MQRITITVDDELVVALDHVIAVSVYQNRSEAIRDLMRVGIAQFQLQVHGNDRRSGVAALVYVYDHQACELAKRLASSSHEHHDLSVTTMHVHLDHDSCMEVAVLKGAMSDVRHFAQHVISERGGATESLLLYQRNLRTKSTHTVPSQGSTIFTST
jgi:CopG family nickel-responsive transcriptional regulator